MDFATAVNQVVDAHAREIKMLRYEIAGLRSQTSSLIASSSPKAGDDRWGSNASFDFDDSRARATFTVKKLDARGDDQLHDVSTHSIPNFAQNNFTLPAKDERHHRPLRTPRFSGASTPRTPKPEQPSPMAEVSLPTECVGNACRMKSSASEPAFCSGKMDSFNSDGYAVRVTSSSSAGHDRRTTVVTHASSAGTASRTSFTSACEVEDDANVGERIAKVYQRWVDLVGAMFSQQVQYCVHDGWHDGLAQDAATTYSVLRVTGMSDALRAALHKHERSCSSTFKDDGVSVSGKGLARGKSRLRLFRTGSFSASGTKKRACLCVLHPASKTRRFWIVGCLVVILYEVFAITMAPFGVMSQNTATGLEWFSACFWSLDIVVNFLSGVYVNGRVEMRLHFIARKYIKTWFLFDLLIAGSQLATLLVDNGELDAALFLRLVRCVRSVRLGRLVYWLKEEFGLSSAAVAGGQLFQFMMTLVFFVHCTACVWYDLGKSRDGWVSASQAKLSDSPSHNYLVALHWALSQLQGNVDIFPGASTVDRMFAVISSLASIVVLACFVSSMTDTLFNARQLSKRRIEEKRLLNTFFGRHDVDPDLRARAEHHLFMSQEQKIKTEDHEMDERFLQMFPSNLKSLLLAEIRAFGLVWHPVFTYLQKHDSNIFVKACAKVLVLHTYEPNEDVFRDGENSNHTYYVQSGAFVLNARFDLLATVLPWLSGNKTGRLEDCCMSRRMTFASKKSDTADSTATVQRTASSTKSEDRFVRNHRAIKRLTCGQIVSEASLWIKWMHVGHLCAVGHGQCFNIGTNELVSVLKNHGSHAVFSSFAYRFLAAANILQDRDQAGQIMELMNFRTVLGIEAEQKPEFESEAHGQTSSAPSFWRTSLESVRTSITGA